MYTAVNTGPAAEKTGEGIDTAKTMIVPHTYTRSTQREHALTTLEKRLSAPSPYGKDGYRCDEQSATHGSAMFSVSLSPLAPSLSFSQPRVSCVIAGFRADTHRFPAPNPKFCSLLPL